MKKLLVIMASCFMATSALADLEIIIGDEEGGSSIFSSDGKMVVIEEKQMPAGKKMPGHVLVNHLSGEFFMIDTERNEVMKTSVGQGGVTAGAEGVSVNLEDLGGGPKIANYATRKLELMANGESCGVIYGSRDLLKNKGVKAIIESMRSMQQFSRSMMRGMNNVMSVCEQAEMQLADVIESSGVPMRIIDKNGKRVSEVLAVDTNKKFPADHYKLPTGMKVVDMNDKMNQAAQQTQQMMGDMPDMEGLMKKLEQGGQMDEETIKKMQDMMKQLQQ